MQVAVPDDTGGVQGGSTGAPNIGSVLVKVNYVGEGLRVLQVPLSWFLLCLP